MATDSLNPSLTSFRSRRSYPSLNHTSITPLAPQFPVDDGNVEDSNDSASHNLHHATNPTGTSYLSSSSVPGTPSLLSHSRSGSRVRRHARSKSSGGLRFGNPDLGSLHRQGHNDERSNSGLTDQNNYHRHNHNHNHHPHFHPPHQDPEWMLRAGIALAESTREEKGQSWLAKRESSTSLVSDVDDVSASHHNHHYHRSGRKTTKSGKSTPGAYSRRGSRSRRGSSSGSLFDLSMTQGIADVGFAHISSSRRSRSGITSPTASVGGFPDFVDEHVRAEMAWIQREQDHDAHDGLSSSASSSTYDDESYSEEDIDEQEMRRLTRERGFGFGGWLDRLVEWTLFSVDDRPSSPQDLWKKDKNSVAAVSRQISHDNDHDHNDTQNDAKGNTNAPDTPSKTNSPDDRDRLQSKMTDDDDDDDSADDDALSTIIEKPGDEGGWQDATWLLRVLRHAL